jgi:uncharacterized protein YdiU (UPF0061 family)
MNTDNMSILGQTIDYGPYGWLEDFDREWTPNTTDAQHRRYRYGNQPSIGLWNLVQLANAIFPLIDDVEALQEILDSYKSGFQDDFIKMMKDKLGLQSDHSGDQKLIEQVQEHLEKSSIDMTLFYRKLSDFDGVDSFKRKVEESSYLTADEFKDFMEPWQDWLTKYSERLQLESQSAEDRKKEMDLVNPKYVLRNYMAQLAIDKANEGDNSLIDELFQLLKKPYDEQPEMEKWFVKRPDWAKHKVGCSMLSCSS